VRAGNSSRIAPILAAPSATRFSPKRVWPAAAAARTVSSPCPLVTARRATPAGSLSARPAARAIAESASFRLREISSEGRSV